MQKQELLNMDEYDDEDTSSTLFFASLTLYLFEKYNLTLGGVMDDEIKMPKILPPTDDLVFKTLLTHPDTRDSLKDIIASFTGISVKEVEVANT
ncbi:MAG: hypothetical protein LBP51_05075, partial [Deferribacteraceae bacterium]|nr:hypothetical protein [Deferribacteraceae bacterium]